MTLRIIQLVCALAAGMGFAGLAATAEDPTLRWIAMVGIVCSIVNAVVVAVLMRRVRIGNRPRN